mgnify:FL=1
MGVFESTACHSLYMKGFQIMIRDSWIVAVLLPAVCLTTQSLGAVAADSSGACCGSVVSEQECGASTDSMFVADEATLERFAGVMLPMLPEEQQEQILAVGGLGAASFEANVYGLTRYSGEGTLEEWLDASLAKISENPMTDRQIEALYSIADVVESDGVTPEMCFAPDAPGSYVWMVRELLAVNNPNPNAFQQRNRWTRTVMSGQGLEQGDPTIITYSFVPDGTFIPNAGYGSGSSQLFAWLNSVYGDTATWQGIFAQVFDRWAALTGVSYVYEPNDDGTSQRDFDGVLGIRGDVRIAAMILDGNSGLLAYNFYPEFGGEMVMDAFDSFYNNTFGDSLGFRNVIAHEHGHGLGMGHVCPVFQTKLMEPFVSFAFDGPQLDDVLNGHRHYGDPQEPNDTAAEATDLGSFDVNVGFDFDLVSIDDPDDRDFYKVTVEVPSLITFIVTPDADTYRQGPQTENCDSEDDSSVLTNYNIIHDLRLNVYTSDDLVNPAFTSLSGPPGESEIMEFPASAAGDYFFEVYVVSTRENVQMYRIDVGTEPILAISAQTPAYLEPGFENTFSVTLNPFDQTIETGTESLYYRSQPGAYTRVPLVPAGGLEYTATLPGFRCNPDAVIEFYLEASTIGVDEPYTLPFGGGDAPFEALIGSTVSFFTDNFQSSLGWTVTGPIVGQNAGRWERGVPAGDGTRGDPAVDGDGSGMCFVTGNGAPGSNSDVDGEATILNSPLFDISNVDRPSVSYWRWFDNTGSGVGAGPGEDDFTVEMSDDGGTTWFLLEVVDAISAQARGGWFFVEHDLVRVVESSTDIADFDFTTSQLQFRFIAVDLLNTSVIEAGIDGVSVSELACVDPQPIISLVEEPATEMASGDDFVFDVIIEEQNDPVAPGTAMLAYASGEGLFDVTTGLDLEYTLVPLVHNGGSSYTATIPAQECIENRDELLSGYFDVYYYLQVQGVQTGVTTFPDVDTEFPFGINIGEPVQVFEDRFELDTGWLVSGGAVGPSNGAWERGVPAGDGSGGDPISDADGSGMCYVTGNLGAGMISDVNSLTMLTSPVFDAEDLINPTMRYYHWYNNTGEPGVPGNDVMEVGISYDGGAFYETIDIFGPNTGESMGGWIMSELNLNQFQSTTSTMRVRFLVSDQNADSVIEAGIDGVTISGLVCEYVVACPADLTGEGLLNFLDVSAFLTAYGNQDIVADFSKDGQFNFLDVSTFLTAFGAGCP